MISIEHVILKGMTSLNATSTILSKTNVTPKTSRVIPRLASSRFASPLAVSSVLTTVIDIDEKMNVVRKKSQ
jgi:hypothetical protein